MQRRKLTLAINSDIQSDNIINELERAAFADLSVERNAEQRNSKGVDRGVSMPNMHDTFTSLNKVEAAAAPEESQIVKLKAEIDAGRENNSRMTYNSSLRMKIDDSQLRSNSHQMTN